MTRRTAFNRPQTGRGPRRTAAGETSSAHAGPSRPEVAQASPARPSAARPARSARARAESEAPEVGTCVHCGGPWPIDAMSESAAARLARHYRREVHAHSDRLTAALMQCAFDRQQMQRALDRLFPRLLDATRIPAQRPALERELLEFHRKFIDEGDM